MPARLASATGPTLSGPNSQMNSETMVATVSLRRNMPQVTGAVGVARRRGGRRGAGAGEELAVAGRSGAAAGPRAAHGADRQRAAAGAAAPGDAHGRDRLHGRAAFRRQGHPAAPRARLDLGHG